MLVSLISADFGWLAVIWAIIIFSLCISVLLCFAITLRRMWRNRKSARRALHKTFFQDYLGKALKLDPEEQPDLDEAPLCEVPEMASVFLHYFRTLKGKKLEHLQNMISSSTLEEKLVQSTFTGIRGTRMRAVTTLSYLDSQRSLQVIFNNLVSDDKYVRLTAMRCLVRRESICYLNAIIESCNEAFPNNFKLLAGILAKFGNDVAEPLENVIQRTDNSVVKTACLEALILIMPARTSLDLGRLMEDKNDSVRAAALSLSAIAEHENKVDPLRLGLKDEAVSVKIRAAKMACKVKRADLTADLYKLTSDPVMWVRYWAFRAIWMSGQSGQKFVVSRSERQVMAGNVMLEMRAGYV